MNYREILEKVSRELGMPEEVVKLAYESYWKMIRATITELPLREALTKEDFSQLKTNFNIPSLGKLTCTYDRMLGVKKRFEHLKKLKNDYSKEDKTNVH